MKIDKISDIKKGRLIMNSLVYGLSINNKMTKVEEIRICIFLNPLYRPTLCTVYFNLTSHLCFLYVISFFIISSFFIT